MVILAPTTPEKRQFISSGIEVEVETGRKDIKLGFFPQFVLECLFQNIAYQAVAICSSWKPKWYQSLVCTSNFGHGPWESQQQEQTGLTRKRDLLNLHSLHGSVCVSQRHLHIWKMKPTKWQTLKAGSNQSPQTPKLKCPTL